MGGHIPATLQSGFGAFHLVAGVTQLLPLTALVALDRDFYEDGHGSEPRTDDATQGVAHEGYYQLPLCDWAVHDI